MTGPHANLETSAGTGAGSTANAVRERRNHAVTLLALVLLVPLTTHASSPDKQYLEVLVQQLSPRLGALTANEVALPVEPNCRTEQMEIISIRGNAFGSSSVILRCKGSSALPFTATIRTQPPRSQSTLVNPHTMNRGRMVRLEIVTQGLFINTTAVTLAAGHAGETIPVRATRSNRVFQAQVVDGYRVRAVLEQRR